MHVKGGGWTEVPAMDDRVVKTLLVFILAYVENRNASVGALTMPR